MKKLAVRKAHELGFAAIGFTTADPVDEAIHLCAAIEDERTADMGWLARDPQSRCDPRSLLPEARSVICVALPYGENGINKPVPPPGGELGRARFARGDDYHLVVKEKLKELWNFIDTESPGYKAKLCVDTSPILEKALAQRAGIGWIGKNTILINKKIGSWFVLGEIITDLVVDPDSSSKDLCGECDRCIKACPTSAIESPRILNAKRCISYLTIENKGEIADVFKSYIGDDQYGCDICQEVCPFNSRG